MNISNSEKIEVITREEEDGVLGSRGLRAAELITNTLDVDALRDKFKQFMSSLQSIIDVHDASAGPFQLNEIQFNAEITARGEFKLLGTGIGVEGSGAVTFVLQRKTIEK
jgi:hypothetical protein